MIYGALPKPFVRVILYKLRIQYFRLPIDNFRQPETFSGCLFTILGSLKRYPCMGNAPSMGSAFRLPVFIIFTWEMPPAWEMPLHGKRPQHGKCFQAA